MDVTSIEGALARIEEGVAEARAAAAVLRDGDASAMQELDAVVDALAREVAELKSRTGITPF
jgi:uncharacterized protein YceH (UPF0502 family)